MRLGSNDKAIHGLVNYNSWLSKLQMAKPDIVITSEQAIWCEEPPKLYLNAGPEAGL